MILTCNNCQAPIIELTGKKVFVNIFTMNEFRMVKDIERRCYCGECWDNKPIVINAEEVAK